LTPVAVDFAQPLWLLLLPPLAAFLVAARLPWWRTAWRAGGAALRREGLRLGLRLFWVSLLLLALSGITVVRPLDRQVTVLLLDASASTRAVRDQVEAVGRSAVTGLTRGDLLGVVAFASGAQIEEMPSAEPLFHRLAASLPDTASDLASGLRLAGALVPEGYAGRVALVSDGRQTRGDAVAAARELAGRGIVVDVVPVAVETVADVRLEAVDLPETAYQGETSTLTARIYSGVPTGATVRIYQDGRLLLERRVELRAGRQEMAMPVPAGEPGLHRYRVDVTADDPSADGTAANNALGAVQRVEGPPRVLVVAPGAEAAGFLPAALRAGGAAVSVAAPSTVPSDLSGWSRYDAVVLADLPAESLPPGAMDLLERYVRDLGRGLVMTGGPDAFGPGGYADTPVERALPVDMDLKGRGRQPSVAMLLVIDRSGSMSGEKMEMAKEAAVRSIRLLRPEDQAGVLAFDSVPQWVAPLTPITELERLERAIGSIYAGGGTEIYPAMAAGFAAIRDADADVKHIILMTDGHSGSGGDYGELIREMRETRTTLSSVAVGSDSDTALLEAMARVGRGRYHFTTNAEDIPQIFAQETIMATRTVLVDAPFYPAAASGSPLLRGLNLVPQLEGYVAVTPKEQAEVVLVSPEGDPVLAAWQYGLGRSVAWTPDVSGRWSGRWDGSPAATTLWGNVLSWMLPSRDQGELAVQVEPMEDGAIAIVAESRGGWDETRPTTASLLGPEGQETRVDLAPAGPGRYRAEMATPGVGAYVVRARQEVGDGEQLYGETGWVAPYPTEYRESGADRAFLAQVAAAGGGRVVGDPAELMATAQRSADARWPAGPLLLILAALLWPLEIASRRLVVPVAGRLAALRERAALGQAWGRGDAGARSAAEAPEPAAVGTAERLLERTRALREKQRR
jgi:Ca-activated chloride channel homolog